MSTKHIGASNYLDSVSEFITFLTGNGLGHEEILSHIVLVVLSDLNAEAITLDFLNDKNQVENMGRWGMPFEMIKDYVNIYNFTDRYPSTDTLRYRTFTYVNTLPDWSDDYPLLKNLPYTTGAKSFIAFPIEKAGTPVAAIGIFSRDVIHPNSEIESFLKTVGNVFSMYMFSQESASLENSRVESVEANRNKYPEGDSKHRLTERQLVILRLISEEHTNIAISNLLGYSESTIRQETMKIFSKLKCEGRKEAAQMYKNNIAF
jgi:DNA-binding CsgD family transcriptional regulator